MAAPQRSREEWRRLVAALASSELGLAEFARRRRLNARTLAWWRWRLGCEEPRAAGFVPVVVANVVPPSAVRRELVEAVLPNGVRLRFEHELDAAGLRALAAAFGG
jgi:hypothetical protein